MLFSLSSTLNTSIALSPKSAAFGPRNGLEDEEENSPIIYTLRPLLRRDENFVARFSDSSISSFTLSNNGKAPVGVVFRLRVRDPLKIWRSFTRVFSFYARIFSSFFFKVQILTTFSAPKNSSLIIIIIIIMAEHLASIFGTEKDRVNCPFYFKVRRHTSFRGEEISFLFFSNQSRNESIENWMGN